MTLRKLHFSSLLLLLLACQPSEADESGGCDPGSLNCECAANQLCLAGLECNAGVCVGPGDGDPGDGDPGDGDPGDGDPGDGDPGDGDPGDGDSGDGDSGDGDPGDGDGDSGDGDGDPGCGPGLMDCGNGCVDLMSDDNNCGDCGIECKITEEIGHCVDGQCGNAWSDCHDADDLKPCSEVCQDEGLTCMAQGCKGGTELWYVDLDICQGVDGASGGSDLGCDEPMTAAGNWYRCCCAQ